MTYRGELASVPSCMSWLQNHVVGRQLGCVASEEIHRKGGFDKICPDYSRLEVHCTPDPWSRVIAGEAATNHLLIFDAQKNNMLSIHQKYISNAQKICFAVAEKHQKQSKASPVPHPYKNLVPAGNRTERQSFCPVFRRTERQSFLVLTTPDRKTVFLAW